jgi:hypothetical protein
MVGWVNFAHSQLTMVTYRGTPSLSTEREDVRQVGHAVYHKFVVAVPKGAALPKDAAGGGVLAYLDLSRWDVQRTDQPVAAQALPLGAFSGAGSVNVVGSATVSGVSTTEYRVAMPGRTLSGTKLEPFTVDIWLDHQGRVRRTWSSEVETSKWRSGTLRFTIMTTLSDFGAPVHVQTPPHPQPARHH